MGPSEKYYQRWSTLVKWKRTKLKYWDLKPHQPQKWEKHHTSTLRLAQYSPGLAKLHSISQEVPFFKFSASDCRFNFGYILPNSDCPYCTASNKHNHQGTSNKDTLSRIISDQAWFSPRNSATYIFTLSWHVNSHKYSQRNGLFKRNEDLKE